MAGHQSAPSALPLPLGSGLEWIALRNPKALETWALETWGALRGSAAAVGLLLCRVLTKYAGGSGRLRERPVLPIPQRGVAEMLATDDGSVDAVLRAEIIEVDDPRWAELAASHPDALPFHHPAWVGLVCDCYGFRPFVAAVSAAEGSLSAGIPVVEVRDPLRRRRWVSLPFTDHCSVLYDSEPARDALLGLLRGRAAAERVASVELRTALGSSPVPESVVGVLHELALGPDCDEVYRRFDKSRVRGSIRRAQREGVTVRAADCEDDVSGTYYDLHVRTRRRLGVPAQPRRFFRLLWERVIETGLGFVLLAHVGTSVVAGAVFLDWNGHLIYKFEPRMKLIGSRSRTTRSSGKPFAGDASVAVAPWTSVEAARLTTDFARSRVDGAP